MFADDLERWTDATALIAESGEVLTYARLAERADAWAAGLEPRRGLLYLEARTSIETVVAYLGALRARWPVMWAASGQGEIEQRLVDSFQPERLAYHREGEWVLDTRDPAGPLHPELAVLLSTSGSTGSPKLVRLSRGAVDANARQIVEYLGITQQDRAITSLPLGYSYGLSVLNSHLAAGAAVLLTDRSVTDPEFWRFFRGADATSIAGVPYTYELFERMGLRADPPPSLRTMTQAGGRLAPELVATYAHWSREHGIRFFPMYGQTEATARMAFLPPELAEAHPDCIGRPIPGGEFRLVDEAGLEVDEPEVPGELVYRGPNVMMGYALDRSDLAEGAEIQELRTGDIAVRVEPDLYKIVGRASRFSKIAGKRISFEDLEKLLAAQGQRAVVTGDDTMVAIWRSGAPEEDGGVRERVAKACGLPFSALAVVSGDEPPRLPSGKPDYGAILRQAKAAAGDEARRQPGANPIAAAYAAAFGRLSVDPGQSFVSLGGDSLAYVQASIEVEHRLGFLPDGWENMSIAELDLLAQPIPPPPPRRIEKLSTDVVVRAIAIVCIVLGHIPAIYESNIQVTGGALTLFMLAGYSLARFQRGSLYAGRPQEVLTSFFLRVLIPYYLMMIAVEPVTKGHQLTASTVLLYSNFTHLDRGPLNSYWFPEAIVQTLAIFGALFLLPSVRRFAQARPFASSLVFLAVAMAANVIVKQIWVRPVFSKSPDAWAYGLVAGWAICFARTTAQRVLVLALVTAFAAWALGPATSNFVFITLASAAVLFIRRIPLPRLMSAALVAVAASSYFIYLVHKIVIQVFRFYVPVRNPIFIAAVAVGLGFIAHRVWQFALPRLTLVAQRAWSWFAALAHHEMNRPGAAGRS